MATGSKEARAVDRDVNAGDGPLPGRAKRKGPRQERRPLPKGAKLPQPDRAKCTPSKQDRDKSAPRAPDAGDRVGRAAGQQQLKVPRHPHAEVQSSRKVPARQRLEPGAPLRVDSPARSPAQQRERARIGHQSRDPQHEAEGSRRKDEQDKIGVRQQIAHEGEGICESEPGSHFSEPTTPDSSPRVERRSGLEGTVRQRDPGDEPGGRAATEECPKEDQPKPIAATAVQGDRGGQRRQEELHSGVRAKRAKSEPPGSAHSGSEHDKRSRKRQVKVEASEKEMAPKRKRRKRKGKDEVKSRDGSGVSELHPDVQWENLGDYANDLLVTWLKNHVYSGLSGVQMVNHLVMQIWKSGGELGEYLHWSLQPTEVTEEKVRGGTFILCRFGKMM